MFMIIAQYAVLAAPSIASIAEQRVPRGNAFTFSVTVSGTRTPLTLSVLSSSSESVLAVSAITIDNGDGTAGSRTVTIADPSVLGTTNVVLRLTDGGNTVFDSNSFAITVAGE